MARISSLLAEPPSASPVNSPEGPTSVHPPAPAPGPLQAAREAALVAAALSKTPVKSHVQCVVPPSFLPGFSFSFTALALTPLQHQTSSLLLLPLLLLIL